MPTPFDPTRDLERRVSELEIQMIRVASEAKLAWDAERERSRKSLEFWWNAYRLVAVLTVVAAWGLLVFRLR